MDPKPYLEYLGKEMTIMGLLSAFAVAITSFATERIFNSDMGLLKEVAIRGRNFVLAGAASALVAALFFYLQRSHLAWYYGQITLAQSRGSASPDSIQDWLTWSDGWDSWMRYQTGFAILVLSFFYYGYAIGEALANDLVTVPLQYSMVLPLLATIVLESVRWYVLSQYPQEDRPFRFWVRSLRT